MKVCATIEARMGSSRLPGKVLLPLADKESLWHIYNRLSVCNLIDEVIVATTFMPADIAIVDFCEREGFQCFAGSENNILDRLLKATAKSNPNVIVQATGDNPFIDPYLVEEVISPLLTGEFDYVGNHDYPIPMGLEVRAFLREALEKASGLTNDPIDLVHGSYFLYQHPEVFRVNKVKPSLPKNWQAIRLTVDEAADYNLAYQLYRSLYKNDQWISLKALFDFIKLHPSLLGLNRHVNQKTPEQA